MKRFSSMPVLPLLAFAIVTTTMTASAEAEPVPRIRGQIDSLRTLLQGERVGLLTNPTGVNEDFSFIADELVADPGIEMVSFFAPEHGLRGDRQAGGGDTDYTDPVTGLPVYSLYGVRSRPDAGQLDDIDVLVFDIQDVGTRFYTFVWTMAYSLEACADNGTKFVVFDRPNPQGIDRVEGSPIPFNAGLIGPVWSGQPFGVATRHGMTAGEIATLVNEEWLSTPADLTVVAVPGYTGGMTFAQTGYPWVIPSPNMPTIDTATVYPGTGIFEALNVSEGRGTTRPFELIGAPWIDGNQWAANLNGIGLPGVRFRFAAFEPSFDDYSGQRCSGVQVHVTDSSAFEPIRTGIEMVRTLKALHPAQVTIGSNINSLSGVPGLQTLVATQTFEELEASWQDRLDAFLEVRGRNLIYPRGVQDNSWRVR